MDKSAQKRKVQFAANRNAFVFLSCFLLAVSIWFINALSKPYTASFQQKIIYKGLPVSVSIDELPQQLVADVSGRGFDLMQYSFSHQSSEVTIDADKLSASVLAGNPFAVNTVQLLMEHNSALRNQITFNRVIPEVIQLDSRERFSKKVPVKADVKILFKKQYASSGPLIIQPDSIYISGDSLAVKNINEVRVEPVSFEQLDNLLFRSLKIKQETNSGIAYSTNKVWVYQNVEPYTEASVSIPITILNNGMKQITLVPDVVMVNYHIPLNVYSKIHPEQFEASVDFNGSATANKLKVTITRRPVAATHLSIVPSQVDFFIKQK